MGMSDQQVPQALQLPPKTSFLWLKNTSGKADAILTLMVLSFLIVTGAYLASILGSVTIGGLAMTFNAFDVSYATAVMIPLMMTYAARRYTSANAKNVDYK